MRREWVIILGVLVPFFALVLLGVWFETRATESGLTSPRALASEGPALTTHLAPLPVAGGAGRGTPPPADASLEPASGSPSTPSTLEQPLLAVKPHVRQCFVDHREHLKTVQYLDVTFRPLSDGGFGDVSVPPTANPYIGACVEDVFEEVGFTPSGTEDFERVTYRFAFDPRGGD